MPRGRPKKPIDWDKVEKLCALHCTGEEIADILGCSFEHLQKNIKRKYKVNFLEFFRQKSSNGKMSLRRRQYTKAVDEGNTTMLIWLGKQWLGQSDKQEIKHTHSLEDMSDDELDNKLNDLKGKL